MHVDLLITNVGLLPSTGKNKPIEQGFLAITKNRISHRGTMSACPPLRAGTILDGQGQLAMSGLVNGHCHAAMTLFRGLADDLSLDSWLHDHIFPAEARHVSEEMVYWCSKLAAAELLLGGVTTVADGYFHENQAALAFRDAGIRAVPAQGVVDFPAPGVADPADNIKVAGMFLEHWQHRHPLISPALFAHSPYTCSNATLKQAKTLTRNHGVPLFIHVAETRHEINLISEPLSTSPIKHLAALDILDEQTVCVHCVWADQDDLHILADTGAAVIICPQSNLKLASGMAPLPTMLDKDIPIGLGTDGPASNNTLDMFREMDICAKVHKLHNLDPIAVPASTVIRTATGTGAGILGLPTGYGTLAPGSPADLILINSDQPHLQPFFGSDLVVYAAGAADVQSVIVDGTVVVDRGNITTFDLEETMTKVRRLATSVLL